MQGLRVCCCHVLSKEQLQLAHGDATQVVIGACYTVYNALGGGFLESVYANALAIELTARGVAFRREQPFAVHYRGQVVGDFRTDFVVEEKVMLELKAVDRLADPHAGQLINYLKSAELTVGLLLNFGPKATFRRFINDGGRSRATQLPTADDTDVAEFRRSLRAHRTIRGGCYGKADRRGWSSLSRDSSAYRG